MFCSQCGNAINLSDKFCSKCGTASTTNLQSTTTAVFSPQMPNFGSPYARWWGSASAVTPFREPYEWLTERSTLLVFDNYLALVRGAEKRSDAADSVTSGAFFGLVGGVAAGLFGTARALKDKISNKSRYIGS